MTAPNNTSLQANFKLPNGDLINVYGDSAADFEASLKELAARAQLILDTGNLLRGAQTVVDAGLTGAAQQQQPQQSAAQPKQAEAQQPASSGPRTIQDRFGNTWEYDRVDAPITPRGAAVVKRWTAQSGKKCAKWHDPAAGPEWFTQKKPKIERDQQWEGAWVND